MRKEITIELNRIGTRLNNFQQANVEYVVELTKSSDNIYLHLEIFRKCAGGAYDLVKEITDMRASDLSDADKVAAFIIQSFLLHVHVVASVIIPVPMVATRKNVVFSPNTRLIYTSSGGSLHDLNIEVDGSMLEIDGELSTSLTFTQESVLGKNVKKFTGEVIDILNDVALERVRQVEGEKLLPVADVVYDNELLHAAIAYIIDDVSYWPWDRMFWKPTTEERNLTKAMALLVAHIQKERIKALT